MDESAEEISFCCGVCVEQAIMPIEKRTQKQKYKVACEFIFRQEFKNKDYRLR